MAVNLAMDGMGDTPGLALEFVQTGRRPGERAIAHRTRLLHFIPFTMTDMAVPRIHGPGKFMKTILKMLIAPVAMASLSACTIATKAYVDPQYHQATSDAIHPLAQPIPVQVTARFQTNGKPTPAVDAELQRQLEQALTASGVFSPATGTNAAAQITVTANDSSDLEDARHRGFHTGLTLGSTGSMIDDNYEFTMAYRHPGGTAYQAIYKHAIHTTFGKINGPAGATPTTTADAFHHVVGDVVMNFVWDLQSQGLIGK